MRFINKYPYNLYESDLIVDELNKRTLGILQHKFLPFVVGKILSVFRKTKFHTVSHKP